MAAITHHPESWVAKSVTHGNKVGRYKLDSISSAIVALIVANLVGMVVFLLILIFFLN